MTVVLFYHNDPTPTYIDHVRSLALSGPNTVEVATFGNEPVTHRKVVRVEVVPFDFPFLP